MPTTPRRNLGAASEPWGRAVDKRLNTFQQTLSRTAQESKNALKGVTTAVSGLKKAISALKVTQAQILTTQQQLLTQQQLIEKNISDIQITQEEAPQHQIKGATKNITGSNIGLTPNSNTTFSTTATIPSRHDYVWLNVSLYTSIISSSGSGLINYRVTVNYGFGQSRILGDMTIVSPISDNGYEYATFQDGFPVSPGDSVSIVVEVWKTASGVSSNLNVAKVVSSYTTYKR